MHVAASRTGGGVQQSIIVNLILAVIATGFVLFTILEPCLTNLTARPIGC